MNNKEMFLQMLESLKSMSERLDKLNHVESISDKVIVDKSDCRSVIFNRSVENFNCRFYGEYSYSNIIESFKFLEKLNKYVVDNELERSYRFIVESCFYGPAEYWLNTVDENITWEEFVLKYKERYLNERIKEEIRENILYSSYDGRINPIEYLRKLYDEARLVFVNGFYMSEENIFKNIAKHYSEYVYNKVTREKVNSLNKFVNLLEEGYNCRSAEKSFKVKKESCEFFKKSCEVLKKSCEISEESCEVKENANIDCSVVESLKNVSCDNDVYNNDKKVDKGDILVSGEKVAVNEHDNNVLVDNIIGLNEKIVSNNNSSVGICCEEELGDEYNLNISFSDNVKEGLHTSIGVKDNSSKENEKFHTAKTCYSDCDYVSNFKPTLFNNFFVNKYLDLSNIILDKLFPIRELCKKKVKWKDYLRPFFFVN